MKRYEMNLEMTNGKTRTIEVEGTTQGDAMKNFTGDGRFVRDLKTLKLVNKDCVQEVEFVKEVKEPQ